MNPETLQTYKGYDEIVDALCRSEPLIEVPDAIADAKRLTRAEFAQLSADTRIAPLSRKQRRALGRSKPKSEQYDVSSKVKSKMTPSIATPTRTVDGKAKWPKR